MSRRQAVAFSCSIAVSIAALAADQKRALEPEDYYRLETVADAHIAPAGDSVAYVVGRIDRERNRKQSSIWLARLDGGAPARRLTSGANSTHPQWSPDGRTLAFLSSRPDPDAPAGAAPKAQVYLLSMHGGEAREFTHMKNGVQEFTWSPDGSKIALVSRDGDARETPASDVRHYRWSLYKMDGAGFYDNRCAHIFVQDLESGAANQITAGDARNDAGPEWSPDGAKLAFVGMRLDSRTPVTQDVWLVPAAGGEPQRVSDHELRVARPRWSPDGRRIAYVASDANEVPKLWIAPAGGGRSALAAAELTYPDEVEWAPDGEALYVMAPFRGEHHQFRVDPATQKNAMTTPAGRWFASVDRNEKARRMVYIAGDSTHPADLFTAALDGRGERQLTHMNQALWAEVEVPAVERMTYKSVDGWQIDGFLIKPAGWQAGRKYPMILSVHGGPNGMYGINWSDEFQVFAARGWAVFYTNPRGSSGYGEKFQRGVDREWGGKAYQDIMCGVDAVLEKNPWIDATLLGVRGQSYGGFMTNWIVGHTERFRAAATLSGISDFISVDGIRDAYYGHAYDFGGDLFENFPFYWNQSPIKYASQVKTPTLVLHGDADQRVPLSQGEEWFRALRHFGVTSELVIFPREPHSIRAEPKHAVELMKWQIYWFDRFLNGNEAAARP